ncbi:MAG: hypothetical protein HY737_07015 [Candidatus Omnitrophica bacterium]|nr:hypothetical protein [Candidatus Omnitrophota bacterium]
MKKWFLILFTLFLSGCGSAYDKGYEDVWEERGKDPLMYVLSGAYQSGYQQGERDYADYNKGCAHADGGEPKQRFDSYYYDLGYSECQ